MYVLLTHLLTLHLQPHPLLLLLLHVILCNVNRYVVFEVTGQLYVSVTKVTSWQEMDVPAEILMSARLEMYVIIFATTHLEVSIALAEHITL